MITGCARCAPLLLALVALCACTLGPNYVPPTPLAPAAWNRLEPGPEVCVATPHDLATWWTRLGDPHLNALVQDALRGAPDLRIAAARLRQARARRTISASGLFPELSASGSGTRSQSSREVGTGRAADMYSTGFDASWELDLFGAARRDMEATQADFEASAAALHNAHVTLVAEIASNYVEVRALQERLRIARANLASQEETHRITGWRAEAGLATVLEVEQARAAMEQTRAQIPSLETNLAETEHSLDILLGLPPGTLRQRLDSPAPLPDIPPAIAVGIPADTLRQRPDIRAAERTLAAESARVGKAEAARYPSLTLSGSIGLEALSLGRLGASGADTSTLAAGITAPIFNAGRLRAQVAVQDAVREQALASYEQAVLTALREVENALVALQRGREREIALGRALEAARNAADMAAQNYAAGLTDFQTVLSTERTLLAIEDSHASTRDSLAQALIQLYKALGGGWNEPGPASEDTP